MHSTACVFIILFSLASWGQSAATAILSLKKGAVITDADLKKLSKYREIKSISPMFSKQEQQIIKSLKAHHLAKSWIIELRGTNSFDLIEREIRRQGLPLALDWNEIHISTLDFVSEQWGLHNRGLSQSLDLDPMLVYKVPGRAGEDIGYVPSPLLSKKIRVAVLDTGIDHKHPDLQGLIVTKPSECAALEKYKACQLETPSTEVPLECQKLAEDKRPACIKKHNAERCDKIWMNTSNPEVDQDKNGYPLDCRGWSTSTTSTRVEPGKILGKADFTDNMGHGTHVAGIIAALRGNNLGVDGVSSQVELLPIQVITNKPNEPLKPLSVDLSPIEPGTPERKEISLASLVARGVLYAIHSGAKVLNFSMGWPEAQDSQFMRALIAEAQSRGIIVVAAAGNDSTRALLRPCAYPGVICVGAHSPDGSISHFSNFGSGVDIFAPGLNILSTYPEHLRPVRFRKNLGYEFLSGTSQATPFVSGVVAEMMARGVPSNDILPRLILGSRPVKKGLPLTEGTPHSVTQTLPEDIFAYTKWGYGGLMDMSQALKVSPQALIMTVDKEKIEVPWNRRDREVRFKFNLKNIWKEVPSQKVQVSASFVKPHAESIRPRMTAVQPAENYAAVWRSQETRSYVATFLIEDAANPQASKIPSDMDVAVMTLVDGAKRTSYISLEMTVALQDVSDDADITEIPVVGMPQGQTETIPIDQYFDSESTKREYIITNQRDKTRQVWTLQQTNNQYVAVGGTRITVDAEPTNNTEIVIGARMDWNLDGRSDYVVGYMEDKSRDRKAKSSPFSFYFFDSNMNLMDSFKFDSPMAQMPLEIFWHRIGDVRMPSWVGHGRDPEKKRGLRDRWENPDDYEDLELRFYYLDATKKLKAIGKYEGYHFADVLQPTREQEMQGRVPVLLAKNKGTEAKPSYLYEFAVAEVFHGQVENFRKIDFFGDEKTYRNILDTRVDRIISLNPKDEYLRGTFWFGEGRPRQQRLTTLDNQSFDLKDYHLGALRAQFDSALFTRGVFAGRKDQFAYVITNSEIQLHHLNRNQVAQTSLDRYSFFGRDLYINLYFPLTVKSATNDTMLPGLLVPEGTGLNRGVKLLVPVFAYNGNVIELVSPARLRLKTDRKADGCSPMETPVFEGVKGTSLDYYCSVSKKILRVNLSY